MSSNKPLSIMILEDNRADVHLLKKALQQAELDFTAVVFEDGESAFQCIDGQAGPEAGPIPDAVILDLNVPKRDGSEVLAYMKDNPKWSNVPAIVLSSAPKEDMRNRAAQGDCYITKPVGLDEYLQIGKQIRDCIESVKAARTFSSDIESLGEATGHSVSPLETNSNCG